MDINKYITLKLITKFHNISKLLMRKKMINYKICQIARTQRMKVLMMKIKSFKLSRFLNNNFKVNLFMIYDIFLLFFIIFYYF